MGSRFLEYLRFKGISQKRVSVLSGVTESTVSRFCCGQVISSDKLMKIIEPFTDLSLEWLFFGRGPMLRKVLVVDELEDYVVQSESMDKGVNQKFDYVGLLRSKDLLILEKDRLISEKDRIILELLKKLS